MAIKVYISGQITGLHYTDAEANFNNASDYLTNNFDYTCINPMREIPFNKDWGWEDYMKADIKLLMDCDAIFMLNNYKNSKGATIELMIATALGLTIMYQPK